MTLESNSSSIILAPISIGELVDKITILEIKKVHMSTTKVKNVVKELKLLKFILKDMNLEINLDLINSLRKVNNSLWEIEDKIRSKENDKNFGQEFIQLARSVYKENDIRAAIKNEINRNYNSDIIEEKSYKPYSP